MDKYIFCGNVPRLTLDSNYGMCLLEKDKEYKLDYIDKIGVRVDLEKCKIYLPRKIFDKHFVKSFKVDEIKDELINHCKHYTGGSVEPLDLYKSKGELTGFSRSSIIKYAYRLGDKKGEEKKDVLKIIDYALILADSMGIDVSEEELKEKIEYRFKWCKERKANDK